MAFALRIPQIAVGSKNCKELWLPPSGAIAVVADILKRVPNLMNGLLSVNKASGITSRDAVNIVQRKLRPTKVGHTGTLDPLATGVLVLTVGKATRLTEYVQRMAKEYVGDFQLGRSSDTEDIEGTVTELEKPPIPTLAELKKALPQFVGTIDQVPPLYSALKVKGRRAYELARSGKIIELAPRRIEVYSLEITHYDYPDLQLRIKCGSGTYVRSLGRDIARAVGSAAVMTSLERTAIGQFHIGNCIPSEDLADVDLGCRLLPMTSAVADLQAVNVSVADIDRLRYGRSIEPAGNLDDSSEAAAIGPDNDLAAILVHRANGWGPVKSFLEQTT
ncbi:MAG: tRNA pseudouridine(55) synthase TruB [Planctomycetales bacterium]|nr:tRNA pseudouridine(55) synthase TruB [Planctomycetales bacterium]